MRAPRTDPSPAEPSFGEPAVATQRHTGARAAIRPADFLDLAEDTTADEITEPAAHRVAAKLEVDEVHGAGSLGGREQTGGLLCVEAERLVAEHRATRFERSAHVRAMEERRRVHRDQVDAALPAELGGGSLVAR
ncbi:MAG TPA: hypothetical protein VHP57_01095 [Acidimicrobiia bacterium]|nr:hypothetical protein [Acidimicrobiia bacterium]